MKILNKMLVLTMAGVISFGSFGSTASARNFGDLDGYTVYYDKNTFSSKVKKTTDNQETVINLKNDSGCAWITFRMKNKNGGGTYGAVALQRGTRASMSTSGAESGEKYKLGMSKTYNTGGGEVTIVEGTWSPDPRS